MDRCTLYNVTKFLGKRWTLLILLELYKGKYEWKRFNHLKKNIHGITQKILSLRLKELEAEKIIIKRIDNSSYPIKSDYKLTETGLNFIPIIKSIKKWALEHDLANIECRGVECKHCRLVL